MLNFIILKKLIPTAHVNQMSNISLTDALKSEGASPEEWMLIGAKVVLTPF